MAHSFPMPRVYSYTRFSTPEQARGDSARRQIEAAQRYAKENDLLLDEGLSINDLGVSAYQGANLGPEAGLGRFMEAVRTGLVEPGSVLLLESLDRLTRMEPFLAQHLFSSILFEGVGIVTLGDGQKYDRERLAAEPWAFMTAYMVAVRSHEESATKGRRVAAAWQEKRRKVRAGESQRLTRRAPAWLNADPPLRPVGFLRSGGCCALNLSRQPTKEHNMPTTNNHDARIAEAHRAFLAKIEGLLKRKPLVVRNE